MQLTFDEIQKEIKRVFMKYGMSEEKADICARVHTESTYDGVYSHGTGRVARFAAYLQKGWVNPNAEPTLEKDLGSIRIYNGNMGPGVLNALFAVDEGIKLAEQYGIGMVGLKNTTHWMRGGTYGLHAAKKGYIAIMWTNTESIMPPWGGKDCRLGNNPFVIATPGGENQEPLLLDMAISQYSHGKMNVLKSEGKRLPMPGGFDKDGRITDDPSAILQSRRTIPIGYWKGSGLAFMLDVLATVLTDGLGTSELDPATKGSCGGASQVMILIDPKKTVGEKLLGEKIERALEYLKSGEPSENSRGASAPGEGCVRRRKEHDQNGIYVDNAVWNEIKAL